MCIMDACSLSVMALCGRLFRREKTTTLRSLKSWERERELFFYIKRLLEGTACIIYHQIYLLEVSHERLLVWGVILLVTFGFCSSYLRGEGLHFFHSSRRARLRELNISLWECEARALSSASHDLQLKRQVPAILQNQSLENIGPQATLIQDFINNFTSVLPWLCSREASCHSFWLAYWHSSANTLY